VSASDTE
jgi:hypothetical protein